WGRWAEALEYGSDGVMEYASGTYVVRNSITPTLRHSPTSAYRGVVGCGAVPITGAGGPSGPGGPAVSSTTWCVQPKGVAGLMKVRVNCWISWIQVFTFWSSS